MSIDLYTNGLHGIPDGPLTQEVIGSTTIIFTALSEGVGHRAVHVCEKMWGQRETHVTTGKYDMPLTGLREECLLIITETRPASRSKNTPPYWLSYSLSFAIIEYTIK